MKPILFTARAILIDAREVLEDGGLLVRNGKVESVHRGVAERRRQVDRSGAELVDVGDAVIAPGLVDAHAHLELGGLRGKLRGDAGMVSWVGALLRERATLGRPELEAGVLDGCRRLLATGTTAVGEVDATGAARAVRTRLPLRARLYRELLDAGDPARTAPLLESLEDHVPGAGALDGLAPHAPHTTSDALLAGCARNARRLGIPITIHWAETREEVEWLRGRGGPFAPMLGDPPGGSGLERIDAAGLLRPNLSLVHANHPEEGDLELVASRGATVVHCPGSHAFFGRDPAPLEAWVARGVDVALGTDSLASNEVLDLRREMALLRAAHPGLPPWRVFDWATRGGSKAIGLTGEIGELRPGFRADLAVFSLGERGRDPLLDAITAGLPPVESTWVGGERR